jgi:transcriptional regulator of arginine metabolism
MSIKDQRHRAIQEVIGKESISTQSELVDRLQRSGFTVTQATVSRDINELRLVRLPLGRGKHKYALASFETAEDLMDELRRTFRNLVRDVDRGENVVVLKTLDGHATGVALVMDRLQRDDIVGTLAGEDTIMVIARSKAQAEALQDEFGGYIS